MPKMPPFPGTTGRRDWRTAFDAIRKLLANGDDTTQVFRIMRALNVGNSTVNYARLIATAEGGRLAYERTELAQLFAQPGYARQFAPGTVGAAYCHFLDSTGYSADGLAEVSRINNEEDMRHPYAWFGRRVRDTHDIWHVPTCA
jgi:ubiquinone biosynthesis protein COQ4